MSVFDISIKANLLLADIAGKAYKLADKLDFRGLPISIETKKGQTRKGIGSDGKEWKVTMPFDYGYIRGTEGSDGDHVDCFIGPDKNADEVYVIHQCKEDDKSKYDEDKVMLGFSSLKEAIKAYKSAYTGVDLFKGSHTFNWEDFCEEIRSKSNRGNPLECAELDTIPDVDSISFINCAACECGDCEIHSGGQGSGWFTEGGHVSHSFNYPSGMKWKKGQSTSDVVNGVPFKAVEKPDFKSLVDKSIKEPKLIRPQASYTDKKTGEEHTYLKKASAGVIVVEPDNKVWLYTPKNYYGGYVHTFSKGTIDKGEHPQDAAVRELHEETGLVAKIKGYLGDVERNTSVGRYYIGERVGGAPWAFKGDETHNVQLVPIDKDLTNRLRDAYGSKTADHDVLDLIMNHLEDSKDAKDDVSPAEHKIDYMQTKVSGQAGSNPGGTYKGSDGIDRYVKFYKNMDQGKEEATANTIYNDLGIGAPKSSIITTPEGKEAFASEIISGGKTLQQQGLTKENSQATLKGFAADVLTANWDSVGLVHDNILMKGGDAHRIDNGAAFEYRAQGASKPSALLNKITEFDGLSNPSINAAYAKVFQKAGYKSAMDIPDIKNQVQNIVNLEHAHDGWDNYLAKKAPYLSDQQHETMSDMLSSRTELLMQKVGIKGPSIKAEASEFVSQALLDIIAGGPGSGWTAENGHVGHGSLTTYKNLKKAGYKPLGDFKPAGEWKTFTKWVHKWDSNKQVLTHESGWKIVGTKSQQAASGATTVQLKQALGMKSKVQPWLQESKDIAKSLGKPITTAVQKDADVKEVGTPKLIKTLKDNGYVAMENKPGKITGDQMTVWKQPGENFDNHSFITTSTNMWHLMDADGKQVVDKNNLATKGISDFSLSEQIKEIKNNIVEDTSTAKPETTVAYKTPVGVKVQVPATGKQQALASLGYTLTKNKGEADVYTKPGEQYEVHLTPTDETHSKFDIVDSKANKVVDTGTVGTNIASSLQNIKNQVAEGKAVGVVFPTMDAKDVDKAFHTKAEKVVSGVYDSYAGKPDKQKYSSDQIDQWKNNYINLVSGGANPTQATSIKAAEGTGVYSESAAKLGIGPNQVKETQSLIENWTGSSKDSTRVAFNKATNGVDGAHPGNVLEYQVTQKGLDKLYPSGKVNLTRGMSAGSGLAEQMHVFQAIGKYGDSLPDWNLTWKSGGAESWTSNKSGIGFGTVQINTDVPHAQIFSCIDTNPKSFDGHPGEKEYVVAPKDYKLELSKGSAKIKAEASNLPSRMISAIAYLQLHGWTFDINYKDHQIVFREGPDIIAGIPGDNGIVVQAGGQGSGWTTEEGHISHKSAIAKKAIANVEKVNFSQKMQIIAEANESLLAKVLGGKSYNDTEPVDIVLRSGGRAIGLEVKTIVYGKNDRITMNHGAIPRKEKWARKTGAELYTVVIDTREGKFDCYVRKGVGSWSLKFMVQVPGGFNGVKKFLELSGKSGPLPNKMPRTKAAFGVPANHQWIKPSSKLRNFSVLGAQ